MLYTSQLQLCQPLFLLTKSFRRLDLSCKLASFWSECSGVATVMNWYRSRYCQLEIGRPFVGVDAVAV